MIFPTPSPEGVFFSPNENHVILSGGHSPESKDPHTEYLHRKPCMRRSFGALRLLRMTSIDDFTTFYHQIPLET